MTFHQSSKAPLSWRLNQIDVQEQSRIKFVELDATSPQWPIAEGSQDLVLMSYLCGSVPEEMIHLLYQSLG